jgi:O-antigen ligase
VSGTISSIKLTKQNPPSKEEEYLKYFVFFLFFPGLYLFGLSITFYVFIFLLSKSHNRDWMQFSQKNLLIWLVLVIIYSSTLFAPLDRLARSPGILQTFLNLVQYGYWGLLSMYFLNESPKLSMLLLSKWCFYGVAVSILTYYFVPINIDLFLIKIELEQSRNAFVFILLLGIPFSFIYINKTYSRKRVIVIIFFYFLALLLSNGRSAAIIGILEILLLIGLLVRKYLFLIFSFFVALFVFVIYLQFAEFDSLESSVANGIEDYNPRMADLLRGEGDGDLNEDRSWLHRRLMIEKGMEIFSEFPVLGVGANNFKYFDGKLESLSGNIRLNYKSSEYYNRRSSHNSYIQILAEFGILGSFFFLILFIRPFFIFYRKQHIDSANTLILISLVSMLLHFYSISAITGALPWFIIGLANVNLKLNG